MRHSKVNRCPLLLGLIGAVAYHFLYRRLPPASSVTDLLSALINVGGIAIGFLLTAKSILLTIPHTEVWKQLRSGGYDLRIEDKMNSAMWLSFGVVLFSVAGLFLDGDAFAQSNPTSMGTAAAAHKRALSDPVLIYFSIWFGLAVAASAAVYRVILSFTNIVRRAASEQQ